MLCSLLIIILKWCFQIMVRYFCYCYFIRNIECFNKVHHMFSSWNKYAINRFCEWTYFSLCYLIHFLYLFNNESCFYYYSTNEAWPRAPDWLHGECTLPQCCAFRIKETIGLSYEKSCIFFLFYWLRIFIFLSQLYFFSGRFMPNFVMPQPGAVCALEYGVSAGKCYNVLWKEWNECKQFIYRQSTLSRVLRIHPFNKTALEFPYFCSFSTFPPGLFPTASAL